MLSYSQIERKDIPVMAAMFRKYLLDDEGAQDYLNMGFETEGYVGVKCMDGDRIVGVLTAKPGIEFTFEKPDIEAAIKERWGDKRIYTGEMVTVLPSERGRGIARVMVLIWAEEMRRQGGEYLMLELWDRRNGDEPAGGILKYIGEVETRWYYPDFYRDMYKYGMVCPDCGPGICKCGASIVMMKL